MATQVEQLRQTASDAWGRFSTKMAEFDEDKLPSAEDAKEIDDLRASAVDAQKAVQETERLLSYKSEAESRRAENPAKTSAQNTNQPRSLGDRFVSAPNFQSWLKTVAPTGLIPESARGIASPPFEFGGFKELDRQAALITGDSSSSGGAFVVSDQYAQLIRLGQRPLSIRQVITNLTTGSDTVEYVREVSTTNAAAPVAESVATSGGQGVKPESGMTFERVSTAVKTIAHWIPVTKRALSDAGQIRGLIDEFLRYGLDEELEDQIVNGDGSGENMTGIFNTTGTQAQAYDTSLLKTTRVARRKVRTVGRRNPNAYLLNPIDWEAISLLVDGEQRYHFGGPMELGTPRLWGLPVIESEAIPEGYGLVGDFSTCVFWDREQASISVSDSHADFFIRNLVAILAELRGAFGMLKPNAIVEIDLTA